MLAPAGARWTEHGSTEDLESGRVSHPVDEHQKLPMFSPDAHNIMVPESTEMVVKLPGAFPDPKAVLSLHAGQVQRCQICTNPLAA